MLERTDARRTGGERATLRACLDFQRQTLAITCAGRWFRRVIDGQDVPLVWSPDGDSRPPTTMPA